MTAGLIIAARCSIGSGAVIPENAGCQESLILPMLWPNAPIHVDCILLVRFADAKRESCIMERSVQLRIAIYASAL